MQEYHIAQLRANALKVLTHRYLLRDPKGNVAETPEGLFRRVASTIAQAELIWIFMNHLLTT